MYNNYSKSKSIGQDVNADIALVYTEIIDMEILKMISF